MTQDKTTKDLTGQDETRPDETKQDSAGQDAKMFRKRPQRMHLEASWASLRVSFGASWIPFFIKNGLQTQQAIFNGVPWGPLGAQDGPETPQDAPKTPPRRPKMSQDAPKTSQDARKADKTIPDETTQDKSTPRPDKIRPEKTRQNQKRRRRDLGGSLQRGGRGGVNPSPGTGDKGFGSRGLHALRH